MHLVGATLCALLPLRPPPECLLDELGVPRAAPTGGAGAGAGAAAGQAAGTAAAAAAAAKPPPAVQHLDKGAAGGGDDDDVMIIEERPAEGGGGRKRKMRQTQLPCEWGRAKGGAGIYRKGDLHSGRLPQLQGLCRLLLQRCLSPLSFHQCNS